jgi:hypothetical protein
MLRWKNVNTNHLYFSESEELSECERTPDSHASEADVDIQSGPKDKVPRGPEVHAPKRGSENHAARNSSAVLRDLKELSLSEKFVKEPEAEASAIADKNGVNASEGAEGYEDIIICYHREEVTSVKDVLGGKKQDTERYILKEEKCPEDNFLSEDSLLKESSLLNDDSLLEVNSFLQDQSLPEKDSLLKEGSLLSSSYQDSPEHFQVSASQVPFGTGFG